MAEGQLEERVITLAVLPKLPRPSHGEFGWTLPLADNPLSFEILADLLPRVHSLADALLADAPATADALIDRWVGSASRYASA